MSAVKTSRLADKKISASKLAKNDARTCYIMLLLPIIGFFVFTLYPMIWSVKMSFFTYDGLESTKAFVGTANWKTVLTDTIYWSKWLTNLKLFVFKMPVEALLAFIIATLLIKGTKFSGFYRSVYFMPTIISAAVVGVIFANLFDYFGVINANLVKFGIIKENINWYADKTSSFMLMYFATLWMSLGINILYFMAALSTVSQDILESAELDGANWLVQTFKIKLPMILPTMQVIMLLSLNGVLQIGEAVLMLNNGAPGGVNHTVSSYLMSKIVPGFGGVGDIGYAAAMSIVTSIIFCICGITFNKLTTKLQSIY